MPGDVTRQLGQLVQRYFLEFLRTYRAPYGRNGDAATGELFYVEQAKHMMLEKRRTLYVEMRHFDEPTLEEAVSFHPLDLKQIIEQKFFQVRDHVNATVIQFLRAILDDDQAMGAQLEKEDKAKMVKMLDSFRENDHFTVAFYGLANFDGIRTLRTEQMGKLVTICGTVTRTTEVKPELLVGTFICRDCNREITNVVQQFKVTNPAICPTPACGNRTDFILKAESRTTRWGDWQRIRLQENENEVPAGSMPRAMDIIVRDEGCERCKPGDKVMVTGCLIVVPEVPSLINPAELKQATRRELNARYNSQFGAKEGVQGLKELGSRDLTYKLAFYGCFIEPDSAWGRTDDGGEEASVNVRADDDRPIYLTQRQQQRITEISEHKGPTARRDCFDLLAKSIAPNVEGHLEVKKGILLMLMGGTRKETQEGMKLRGDINILLIGDPATAKSQFLKWCASFLPRAVYASGQTSTAAGLTASVTREQDIDEKVIEPGALMLADNGVCCIDEFSLMESKDQVAIHEAMEQQTITLSKAGIQATLNARTSILAAALPIGMRYRDTLPLEKNVQLTAPIMSRFDLKFVLRDISNPVEDASVAEHIMNLHRQGDAAKPEVSQLELQQYIRLARQLRPKVSPGARVRLTKRYKQLRQEMGRGVTVRQLESLLRLAEAVARVHLDDNITAEYVDMAYDLVCNTRTRKVDDEIGLDEPEAAAPDAVEGQADGAGADTAGAPARLKKVKLTFSEYQRIGRMLAMHLDQMQREDEQVTEEDLIAWYMEQVEEELKTEAQMLEHQYLVQLIINRLITRDRVIVVYKESDDKEKPELRVLVKHPNFHIENTVSGRHAEEEK